MGFDFHESYILENSRAKLEPLSISHVKSLRPLAQEKAIWTYFLGRSDGSQDFKGYIEDALEQRKQQSEYPFAVYDKRAKKYAGCTRFFNYQKDLNAMRLGYSWYGKKFHGTGLNKNCKYLLFEFAFERLNLTRVGLGAHAENIISIVAMRGAGCKQEGRFRDLFPSIEGEGRSDAVLFSITKEDWYNGTKNSLMKKL